ncbi:hypothetical protein B9G54_03105 [Alloscardovia macacae]|uniref:ABC-2 family transporter protein n=1 Tax=Alloscardovia macacae TaxID=1160091 RepID=A0A1Y2SUS5_9BIFI|nr:hypothetical protein [Alloscardovia macacae]OTA26788.1 hypothetical protein B9G54_03105 [Alloscardovia macacae]OTA29187.1 hypothetical protein B9T39_04740 [Alloscardovia macacae]
MKKPIRNSWILLSLSILTVYGVFCFLLPTEGEGGVHEFIGMPRHVEYGSGLSENIGPFLFLLCGVLCPLEKLTEYLLQRNSLVYIRRRNDASRVWRYLLLTMTYCAVYTGIQVGVTVLNNEYISIPTLLYGATYAFLLLLCSLLTVTLSIMLSQRALGYGCVIFFATCIAALEPLRSFLTKSISAVPLWAAVFLFGAVMLSLLTAFIFNRIEIIQEDSCI